LGGLASSGPAVFHTAASPSGRVNSDRFSYIVNPVVHDLPVRSSITRALPLKGHASLALPTTRALAGSADSSAGDKAAASSTISALAQRRATG
jgi:hypothetical protein